MLNSYKFLIVAMVLGNPFAHAEDLFDSSRAREYKPVSTLQPDSTIGGYPIFQGGRTWRAISGKTTQNNYNFKFASIQLISPIDNNYFVEQVLMTNLEQKTNAYFTSEVCNVPHLFKLNKGGGRFDDCLTIDPLISTLQNKNITTLVVDVRNSQQGARLYQLTLFFNLEHFGFSQTVLSDWTEEAVAQDVKKKQLIEKFAAWAKKLQDGVNKAIGYNKPRDAFADVPPIDDLLPLEKVSAVDASDTGKQTTTVPARTSNEPRSQTLLQRLTQIQRYLDDGLITRDQYEQLRSEAIKDF